jgi:hypothetical protein
MNRHRMLVGQHTAERISAGNNKPACTQKIARPQSASLSLTFDFSMVELEIQDAMNYVTLTINHFQTRDF